MCHDVSCQSWFQLQQCLDHDSPESSLKPTALKLKPVRSRPDYAVPLIFVAAIARWFALRKPLRVFSNHVSTASAIARRLQTADIIGVQGVHRLHSSHSISFWRAA